MHHNYAFVGSDGELDYFVRNGFAYHFQTNPDDGYASARRGSSPYPTADYSRCYSVARNEYGSDHLPATALLDRHFQELIDPIQWVLYPHQFSAFTLPEDQEC